MCACACARRAAPPRTHDNDSTRYMWMETAPTTVSQLSRYVLALPANCGRAGRWAGERAGGRAAAAAVAAAVTTKSWFVSHVGIAIDGAVDEDPDLEREQRPQRRNSHHHHHRRACMCAGVPVHKDTSYIHVHINHAIPCPHYPPAHPHACTHARTHINMYA